MNDQEEIDKFLDPNNQVILSHEEKENLKRPIMGEIKQVIKNLPTKKNPGLDGFIEEFYQPSRKELIPIILKLFQNLK